MTRQSYNVLSESIAISMFSRLIVVNPTDDISLSGLSKYYEIYFMKFPNRYSSLFVVSIGNTPNRLFSSDLLRLFELSKCNKINTALTKFEGSRAEQIFLAEG